MRLDYHEWIACHCEPMFSQFFTLVWQDPSLRRQSMLFRDVSLVNDLVKQVLATQAFTAWKVVGQNFTLGFFELFA